VRVRLPAGEAGLAGLSSYRVILAYDGTDFGGWQSQAAGGARTVQGVLEDALLRLAGGARVPVTGAGRTDAGVHALGQVAAFRLPRPFPAEGLLRALNGLLPADLRALEAAPCPPDFHPRKHALSKHYRYVLDTGPWQVPQRRRQAGHVPWSLDPQRVHEVAALYAGRHDFASLRSSGSSVKTSVRTITRSDASFDGPTLVYDVKADGFLRKMVRSLVGGLVEAGRGVVGVAELRRALEARDRRAWPAPAEARGLTLVGVEYGPEALIT
jgi:tRNA pseudouridine38-40 synthase